MFNKSDKLEMPVRLSVSNLTDLSKALLFRRMRFNSFPLGTLN